MKMDPDVFEILRHPKNQITINFPVKLKDNTIKMFITGFRVQHSDLLGNTTFLVREYTDTCMKATQEQGTSR